MHKNLRIHIADDEALARRRLRDLLAVENDIEIVAETDNGLSTIQAITDLKPDLLFLDIQMPGLSGLEVIHRVGVEAMPLTVFVTAYDNHALEAFELAALDYLLKPFDDERFRQAFARARKLLALRGMEEIKQRVLDLLHHGGDIPSTEASNYLERITVEMRGQMRVVPVESISHISAAGPYAEIHTDTGSYLIRERMQTLEKHLDPRHFMRIHRSTIVRLNLVELLLHKAGGRYAVRLKNGRRLSVSRNRRAALQRRLGI